MSDTVRLVFSPPGPDTPGYLRRVSRALAFYAAMNEVPTEAEIASMVEFLADFVTEPEGPEAKREALWMASKNEFRALLNAVAGSSGESPS